jgi:hypothetical protein
VWILNIQIDNQTLLLNEMINIVPIIAIIGKNGASEKRIVGSTRNIPLFKSVFLLRFCILKIAFNIPNVTLPFLSR